MPLSSSSSSGATAGVRFVTSTAGNTVSGVTNTVGGIVGAGGRGVAETVEGATGSAGKPVARPIAEIATGVEDGGRRVAAAVREAGEGK